MDTEDSKSDERVVAEAGVDVADSGPPQESRQGWRDTERNSREHNDEYYTIRSKILDVNGHIIVLKYGHSFGNYRDVITTIGKIPEVKAQAPFTMHEGTLTAGEQEAEVLVKGVDPVLVNQVLNLKKYIVEGDLTSLRAPGAQPPGGYVEVDANGEIVGGGASTKHSEVCSLHPSLPGIILGSVLAEKLRLTINSVVELQYNFSDEERQTDFNRDDAYIDSGRIRLIKPLIAPGIKRLPFKVIGIFNFDFSGFDEQLVIVDYFEAERFLNLGDSVTGIEMIVNDFKNATSIARQIDLQLGGPYRTVDWIELNPELFSSDR